MAERVTNIAVRIVPTEEAIRSPPEFANAINMVGDPGGVTLYFFVSPPDASQLPEVEAAVKEAPAGSTAPVNVTLRLEPVGKVYLPTLLIKQLVDLLAATEKSTREAAAAINVEARS